METRSVQGLHLKDWSAEDCLRKVVQEFHSTNGMLQKWFLDEDKVQSILNMITATSAGSRELIANHLHKFKWSQCALTSELLRKAEVASESCAARMPASLQSLAHSHTDFGGDVPGLGLSPVPPQDAKSPTEPDAAVQAECERVGSIHQFRLHLCKCLERSFSLGRRSGFGNHQEGISGPVSWRKLIYRVLSNHTQTHPITGNLVFH